MKAFVTGGTGFLGTHLIKELDRAGWEIIALHRENSNLSELNKCKNIQLKIGDITDLESLRKAVPKKIDAFFHTAGSVAHLPHSKEKSRYSVNVDGTKNVLQTCLENQVGRFIYTSTVVTYDYHQSGLVNESFPRNEWCKDHYVRSKRLAEDEVVKFANRGLDTVFLHPSATFGSFDSQTWSKMFLEIQRGLPLPFAPPGGGSVCHAKKVAQAHVSAFHNGNSGAHYILGGPNVTWLEVAVEIAKILNKKPPLHKLPRGFFKLYGYLEFYISNLISRDPTLTPHTIELLSENIYSDCTKAIRELNYQPSTLQEMLQDCYHWMIATNRLPHFSQAS